MDVLERLCLDGKTAIVTGAGRGLGKAMAKALAQAGAELVCAARTLEQLDTTVQEIHAAGSRQRPQSSAWYRRSSYRLPLMG
jgi:7-alpha-hydroxysteroid dehydrogenase